MEWNDRFLELFQDCLARYRAGDRDYTGYYTDPDLAFLRSIGYKPRELFDFVEDFADGDVPTPSTALLVASVRRDYLLTIQKGVPDSSPLVTAQDLPTFGDDLDGIVYLPRIIKKARAKLKGLLDPDVMYGCGGDRKFLREHGNIHPADFLRSVWAAREDDMAIARYVRRCME